MLPISPFVATQMTISSPRSRQRASVPAHSISISSGCAPIARTRRGVEWLLICDSLLVPLSSLARHGGRQTKRQSRLLDLLTHHVPFMSTRLSTIVLR